MLLYFQRLGVLGVLLLHPTKSSAKNIFSKSSVASISHFECPSISSGGHATSPIPTSDLSSGSISLSSTSEEGTLCTLTLQRSDDVMVPVARSYDGMDWEIAAGPFAQSLSSPSCSSGVCTLDGLTLPDSDDSAYVLTSFVREDPTAEVEAARFLEQTTFGVTRSSIDELVASTSADKFKAWVVDQIENVPMSSHREYWRRRLNARAEYAAPHAVPGPEKACHETSRWRKFALSERDGLNASQSGVSKHLSIKKVGDRYIWYMEGMARTSTSYLPKLVSERGEFKENFEVWPTLYAVYFRDNERYSCVGCLVQVTKWGRSDGDKESGAVANPEIDLTGISSPYTVVDLPPIKPNGKGGMISIDNGYAYASNPYFAGIKKPDDEFLLVDASTVNDAQCNDHPNTFSAGFDFPSELNVSKNPNVKGDEHVETAAPPIFGRALNTSTGKTEYLMFDPRLIIQENTVENPLEDGGGSLAYDTDGRMICSNAPRNFLNEAYCKLSFSKYACNKPHVNLDKPISIPNPDENGIVVCGSVGEVANDVTLGIDDGYDIARTDGSKAFNLDIYLGGERDKYKRTVWVNHALFDEGQLRQRVAWAFYQIIPIGLPLTFDKYSDRMLNYYDIFVRHAFGNYRDILKEISFCDVMSEWLSFTDNKSLQYNIDNLGSETHPDENFAREIMQLFSLGIFQLNMDGSKKLDDNGQPLHSYDSSDIINFSRCWTGFSRMPYHRGNAESPFRGQPMVDPLHIEREYRDVYPKSDLLGGYIGDRYPLCSSLPHKHHLKKGAAYRLLGSTSTPEMQHDDPKWDTLDSVERVILEQSSPLYSLLCAEKDGSCTFPGKVTLDDHLAYDSVETQQGEEYQVNQVRTVRIPFGDKNIHYEYIRAPCVYQTFHNDQAKKLIKGNIGKTYEVPEAICADPRSEIASEMCCTPGSTTKFGIRYLHYRGERLTFDRAVDRCAANGVEQCTPKRLGGGSSQAVKSGIHYAWTTSSCITRVKISYESPGLIGRVDYPDADYAGKRNVASVVSENTKNFFKVAWEEGIVPPLPSDSDSCSAFSSCYSLSDGCICDTSVSERPVFLSAGDISSTESISTSLFTGAFDPTMYDDTEVISLGDCGVGDGVSVYSTSLDDSCSNLGSNAFFGVIDHHGTRRYLQNVMSVVEIVGVGASFRNVPGFISLVDQDLRDMYYETDAVIDHFHRHPSHAPFLAIRLLQRFGISNPSPGYIERVATAYVNGSYEGIGSGSYGDLSAMISALLLDAESRSLTLDLDPSHGHIREPIIKVTSFFRAMDVNYNSPMGRDKMRKIGAIGQDAYGSPSVFSFFLPEFQPAGVMEKAGLVAPEAQLLTGKHVTGILDGLFSNIKFGLTSCYNGFGSTGFLGDCPTADGDYSNTSGEFSYEAPDGAPVETLIDDLALLLTAGRLGDTNREIIRSAVQDEYDSGSKAKATRIAQQLFIATPEFHSAMGSYHNTASKRRLKGYTQDPRNSYKAVVYLMMDGGVDSFNMIVPTGNCAKKDMYAEYKRARQHVAENKDKLLPIDASGQGQICDKWGINNNLPILKDYYDKGEGMFFLNTGILPKRLTKHDDWVKESKVQLFAHNHMTREAYALDPHDVNAGTGVGGRLLDMLKKNGYQTSGNTVDGISLLNVGDTYYSNPYSTVATGDVQIIDEFSTIGTEKMLNLMKQLNGETDIINSYFGETYSDRLSKSLFEYETALEIDAAIKSGIFEMDNYPKDDLKIEQELRAAAQFMKSRSLRKVDREVYHVRDEGFDMHGGGGLEKLPKKFKEANAALEKFIKELQSQGIWDDTVIIMASDFGRSIEPNSNGGTDHAWGGNYFMLGGGLKGGKIHGNYPEDLSEKSDYWVRKGRLIPTTPWDAVWNAVSTWMGVKGDQDLDFVLPTRPKFDKCTDLFHAHDLFKDTAVTPCIDDADGDGIPDEDDACPDTMYWIDAEVDEFGCQAPSIIASSPPSIEQVPTPNPTFSPTLSGTFYEAEDPDTINPDGNIDNSYKGYTGSGYVDMKGEGSYLEWPAVEFGAGGPCKLEFRYAAKKKSRPSEITIDGEDIGDLKFNVGAEWDDYKYDTLETTCPSGTHSVRLTAGSKGGPNVDHLLVTVESEKTPTTEPTKISSASPSITQPTTDPTGSPSNSPSHTIPTTQPLPTSNPSIKPSNSSPTLEPTTWEAEDSGNTIVGGAVKSKFKGFTGTGYIDMGNVGTYIEFPSIDFGTGGPCKLEFRYAAKKKSRPSEITIDGEDIGDLKFNVGADWDDYKYDTLETACPSGTHSVRLTAGSNGGPNVDHLLVTVESEKTPTTEPTNTPTLLPTQIPSEAPSTLSPSHDPTYVKSSNPTEVVSQHPSGAPTTLSPSNGPSNVKSSDPTLEPAGCYSSNYKDCIPDGFGLIDSLSCSATLKWLPKGALENCIALWGPCEGESESCCSELTCVGDDFSSACVLSSAVTPTLSPAPTNHPSIVQTHEPSLTPSEFPSLQQSLHPSDKPSTTSSLKPSSNPSVTPSAEPSLGPSSIPTSKPSLAPSSKPSFQPSATPSSTPSSKPSLKPSSIPSSIPSLKPSFNPSASPSSAPSKSNDPTIIPGSPTPSPSSDPSAKPSSEPSLNPSREPSLKPSLKPSSAPSVDPTTESSSEPSLTPSSKPSLKPSSAPSVDPTTESSSEPSLTPSSKPSTATSNLPSLVPSRTPSRSPVLYSPAPSGGSLTTEVNSVIASANITVLGVQKCEEAVDGITSTCYINRNGFPSKRDAGFVAIPSRQSVAKKLRVYQNHHNKAADPIEYKVEGRNGESEEWSLISEGSISLHKNRNSEGTTINSTYAEGDISLRFTEVTFLENNEVYNHYQILFPRIKDGNHRDVAFGEVELPGYV